MQAIIDKELSQRLWSSYGVMMAILPYLPALERLQLQQLNKFSYEVLVGRVQTTLSSGSIILYWTKRINYDYHNRQTLIYQYWPSSGVVKQLTSPIDLAWHAKVSVGSSSIFALEHGSLCYHPPPLRFFQITFSEGQSSIRERQSFSKHRGSVCLANYLNKYIFMVGGGVGEKTPGDICYAKFTKTTRLYDIE